MEMGPQLRVSSDRLDEPTIKLRAPGYMVSCLFHTPWQLLFCLVYGIKCAFCVHTVDFFWSDRLRQVLLYAHLYCDLARNISYIMS